MTVATSEIKFNTKGNGAVVDLTDEIASAVRNSSTSNGTVTVFAPGATSGITTIEYEPGLIEDLPEFFEKIIPSNKSYHHDLTWHDGNGFSHLRSALIGPDITIPFVSQRLTLGTWQQVVFLEFDNRPRQRKVIVQIMGE